MTSREKIMAVLQHQPVDSLPIDFGAMRSTGINAMAYNKLVKALGLDEKAVVYDIMQQIARPSMAVVQKFGGDVVQVNRLSTVFGVPADRYKEDVLPDGSPCMVPLELNPVLNPDGSKEIVDENGPVAKMPKDGQYYDLVRHPFADIEDPEELQGKIAPVTSEREIEFILKQAKDYYENTDKAITLDFGGSLFERGSQDFGYEKYYMDLAANPELIHAYNQMRVDAFIIELDAILSEVKDYINVVIFGDDLGTQISPQISPAMYEEMLLPYHQQMYQHIHKNYPGLKVFLHSCGAIEPLLPSLIKAGVDILNPVQISAAGMDPVMLKEKYGEKIVFWGGGADLQLYVDTHSVEEIKEHVEKLIRIFFSDHTGFVFTTVHNIQCHVPPEKVIAIYETAKRFQTVRSLP